MNRREYIKNTALALGLGVSGVAFSEIFIACAKDAKLDWKPVFLSANQAATIAEIAETILPKTKTPGAKELGVPQFIDKMVNDTMDAAGKEKFTKDLEAFDEICKEKYGKNFVELEPAKREVYLLELEKDNPRSGMNLWGINLEPDARCVASSKIISLAIEFGLITKFPVLLAAGKVAALLLK